jgi:hypothetical protein
MGITSQRFGLNLPGLTFQSASRILSRTLSLAMALMSAGCRHGSHTSHSEPQVAPKGSTQHAKVSAIRFEEIGASAGLTYRYPVQPRPTRNIESFGCGCAALDYDDDGWMDILLVTTPHPILYHNRGDGTFEDVTVRAGLDKRKGDWKGCAVGDYDGDGRLDILLTGFRCLALLRNVDGHRFADVTVQAGLDPANHHHWGSSAGFMDLDGSGRLALVLLNYVVFGPKEPQYCELRSGIRSGCPPARYRPEYPELWKNLGNGKFREVTAESGLKDRDGKWNVHGKALVVAFADYDNDGLMDFYIGNDGTMAELMHNEGNLHFKNVAVELGVALGVNGQAQASMGADWADYDRDGRLDLVNTAFADESYSLYKNNGFYFDNVSTRVGIAGPTRKQLGFGVKFLDIDNDGFPDLIFANGHVYDTVARIDPASSFRQPTLLFHNREGKYFDNIGASAGEAFARPILGRGLATADFDNDGRVDVLVVDYEGAPLLLHNVSAPVGHWIAFRLRGLPPNRFAYGAKVTVHSGQAVWVGEVSPASSYLSSSSPDLHFGLGAIQRLDSVEVRWSDHKVERFSCDGVDRKIQIEEGKGRLVPPSR